MKPLVWVLLLLSAVASAKPGDACFPHVAEMTSDAAREWLLGERSATDPELQTLKLLRETLGAGWTFERFRDEVYPKFRRLLAQADISDLPPGELWGRPRLAYAVWLIETLTKVLTPEQSKQLSNFHIQKSPDVFKVADWGVWKSPYDIIASVAAVLVSPKNFDRAMTLAFLNRPFVPDTAFWTYQRTGSLRAWDTSTDVLDNMIGPEHPPISFVTGKVQSTFHPVLLTNPAAVVRVRHLLEGGSIFGERAAVNILRYMFENINESVAHPDFMNIFVKILVNYPHVPARAAGSAAPAFLRALEFAYINR